MIKINFEWNHRVEKRLFIFLKKIAFSIFNNKKINVNYSNLLKIFINYSVNFEKEYKSKKNIDIEKHLELAKKQIKEIKEWQNNLNNYVENNKQKSNLKEILKNNAKFRARNMLGNYYKDFLKENPAQLQLKGCTVGMMNPPYSMGKIDPSLYEIKFINHLLDSLVEDGRAAVIVPQSTFTGKSNEEKKTKEEILKKHTLEGVITLNKNTFYKVGTNPCIAIFKAHNEHPKNKICKFINFENDGYIVSKHIGLIDDGSHRDKKQHLLDVWFGRTEAITKFCVNTTIEATDEWLHSFYYFNDEIPSEEDFKKTVADYLTFEVNMITHGRGYLFRIKDKDLEFYQDDIEEEKQVAESEENYE